MKTTLACCLVLLVIVSALTACGKTASGREYDVRGQILEVQPTERTVTIRHDDIKGFMPAMTMPFKVKDEQLLSGRKRGDLVIAKLLVTDTDAYLTSLTVVGHGDIAPTSSTVAPPRTELLEPGSAVPDVRLLDSSAQPFTFSSLRGSVVALTFIYTRCPLPQFCPAMDRLFSAAAARLRQDATLAKSARLLSISFDPEYDTPSVLAGHARAVGADGKVWRFATADRPVIDAWAPHFGVVLLRGDPNTITHNLRTAIVDRQGRLVKIYRGSDWTVDQLMDDLRKVASGS